MVSATTKDISTPGDGFDLTLLNISAVDLRKEGVSRSIREFMTGPVGEMDEEHRKERRLRGLGIDLAVFEELPEDIRNEILNGGEVGGAVPSTPVAKRKVSGASGSAKRVKSQAGPLDKLWGKRSVGDSGKS